MSDRALLGTKIESVAGQIAALIDGLPDTSIRLSKSEWTVGEAAAHVGDAQNLFGRLVRGEIVKHGDGTPGSLAHANKGMLELNRERNGAVLAAALVSNTQEFLRGASASGAAVAVDGPLGHMDLDTLYTYSLVHLIMHGFPIAAALEGNLVIDRATANLTLPFFKHVLPAVVDQQKAANLRAVYQVRMRGGEKFWVKFEQGAATVYDSKPGRVDCFIFADPVSFMQVGFRWKSQWPMIATGKLFGIGIKPWLAFRFAGLFLPP